MIKLVFLSVICGIASAQYWNHGVQDTPEVAAAKAAHFAAVEKARLSKATDRYTGLYKKPVKKYRSNENLSINTNNNPIALSSVQSSTEIASGKTKPKAVRSTLPSSSQKPTRRFDSLMNYYDLLDNDDFRRGKKSANFGFDLGFPGFGYFQQPAVFGLHDPISRYHGPIALPPGYDKNGAPLPVLDTPEVAAEKAKHLALVAKKRAWYDEHSFGNDSPLGGNDDFIGGSHHAGLSSFHDGGFSGAVGDVGGVGGVGGVSSVGSVGGIGGLGGLGGLGFHGGFKPSLGLYSGGEADYNKFQGGLAFSPGFDKDYQS